MHRVLDDVLAVEGGAGHPPGAGYVASGDAPQRLPRDQPS
jgi:hypothetical protein